LGEGAGSCTAGRLRKSRMRVGFRARMAAFRVAFIVLAWVCNGTTALAQGLPPQVQPRPPEKGRPELPSAPEPLRVPELPIPGRAPPGAEQVKFTLTDVIVEGATVYPPDVIGGFYKARLGQSVTLQEIFDIAAAIETKYRDDGYILTRVIVPVQRIEGGRVTLRVIEGYVAEVKVSGDIGPVRELIESYVKKITQSRPARAETIERYLLLANDVPGITAQGVLQPATNAEGAALLTVNVERDWFSGYARIDNRESRFTGPWRLITSPGLNSFTPLGERIQATGLVALDVPEEGYVALSAETRVGSEGLKLSANISYEETHPGFTLEPLDVETQTLRFGLAASYPVIRSRRTNLFLSGGFDFANIDTEVLGADFSRDDLRVIWAGVQVDHRDSWGGANLLAVQLRQGLGILGATEADDPLASPADADGVFTSLQLNAARRQHIVDNLDLYMGGKAQFSFDPLLADEECSVGGETYGRGYDPDEIADDNCLAGTLELQYNPEWKPEFLKDYVQRYQLYAFYDVGRVWPENGDFADGDALQSAGVGLRTQFTDWLRVDLEVAQPLTRERSADSDGHETQFYLGTVAQF
jgi:hemolysin activation/secretion protein